MELKEYLRDNIIILDGGMGTLLQARGLAAGELPERWNITNPHVITEIHKAYYDAGSNVVSTNTFGANSLKFGEEELEEIVRCAIENAKSARDESTGDQPKWIALDIGPTGKMLSPYGELDFEKAVSVFAQVVRLGAKYGVDLIFIETMSDSYETKAAVLAAKESCDLPVFVSNAYGEDGILMTGANPEAIIAMLEGLGADAIGVNCSLGPKKLEPVVEKYLKYSSLPTLLKPNAGLPRVEGEKTVYDISPCEFSRQICELVERGVRICGGCCGTTPEYISALAKAVKGAKPKPAAEKGLSVISSYTHAVFFGEKPVLIGERINPTGKKKFKEALLAKDDEYVLNEGVRQEEAGAHVLDVNVGLPGIEEAEVLTSIVTKLQAITNLPLQIDTSDPAAMESALRRYNGKAMINSVNGKEESIRAIFPLVKKYGGLVVCLTLDEGGIPQNAEGRVQIAKRIIQRAAEFGIQKKDLIFDPLALTVSTDKNSARETLRAIKIITEELGCNTSLGVSNVSFGLPQRDIINGTFFSIALSHGLSAGIINPHSEEIMKAYYAFCALNGLDDNCLAYVDFAGSLLPKAAISTPDAAASPKEAEVQGKSELQEAIIKGLKEKAASAVNRLLKTHAPLDIVNSEIIPALDAVGKSFEEKRVYLPQLLMSAEASKFAFEIIKQSTTSIGAEKGSDKCDFVIATVKGDIHDIGKNIVKLLLENYGFSVHDLGKNVDPEKIAEEVVKLKAPLVGLSALMTTTVPAMEETIKLLREKAPFCKIVVGGAVLNREYADKIGADKYAKDAMETVRYAEEFNGAH